MLMTKPDHAGAVKSFAKVLQINPSHPTAQQYLTQMLKAQKQDKKGGKKGKKGRA